MGDEVVIFFKNRDLAIFNKGVAVDAVAFNTGKKTRYKFNARFFLHFEGDVITALKFNTAYVVCLCVLLNILAQGAERARAEPWE